MKPGYVSQIEAEGAPGLWGEADMEPCGGCYDKVCAWCQENTKGTDDVVRQLTV